ncbi:hypothetical protein GCM10010492_53590 [Saccharothrix mutabilis subsp. mutabilis]|uniref:Uncharacterized protein n=1 Tax=Saccharothrix mutabilis subsp. mutabilis TaxID=66855 RepID=A0ABP3E281_9PSEU
MPARAVQRAKGEAHANAFPLYLAYSDALGTDPVLLLHDGATLILLLLEGADGLPTATSQHPLDPSPTEVAQFAERLRVNIVHLVAAVRMS